MTANKTDITIVKTFNAPVQSVWKYWSEPKYFKQWWGPAEATCIACHIDFKVGGKFLNCVRVHDANGQAVDMWATGTYKVIEPFKRIVFSDSFADKDGNVVSPSYYGITDVTDELEISLALRISMTRPR